MTAKDTSDPWEDIAPANAEGVLNTRRADPDSSHDFYWARDHRGRNLFILNARKPLNINVKQPKLAGIEISLETLQEGRGRLCLTLVDTDKLDLFRTICRDLMRVVSILDPNAPDHVAKVILGRLIRWQELLKPARLMGLSEQEKLGLFGEIRFLIDELLPTHSAKDTVLAWRGPLGAEQDFGVHDALIEVKSQLATSDQAILISSAAQLDTVSGRIFLAHQTFSASAASTDGAMSLTGIIKQTQRHLYEIDIGASDLFHTCLLEIGYEHDEKYDEPLYTLVTRRFYRVEGDFPRIEASSLMHGVDQVRYRINISAANQHLVTSEQFKQEVFNCHGIN